MPALAGLAATHAGFRSTGRTLAWGLLTGLVAGALSSVISYVLFKGVTATGTTAVVTLLVKFGWSLPVAVTASSLALDLVDKAAAFVLVGVLVRALPNRMMGRFPQSGPGGRAVTLAPGALAARAHPFTPLVLTAVHRRRSGGSCRARRRRWCCTPPRILLVRRAGAGRAALRALIPLAPLWFFLFLLHGVLGGGETRDRPRCAPLARRASRSP